MKSSQTSLIDHLKGKLLQSNTDGINFKPTSPRHYVPYSVAVKREFQQGVIQQTKDTNEITSEVQKFLKEAFEQGLQVEALQDTLDLYMGLKAQLQVTQLQYKQITNNKHKSMDQLTSLNLIREQAPNQINEDVQSYNFVGKGGVSIRNNKSPLNDLENPEAIKNEPLNTQSVEKQPRTIKKGYQIKQMGYRRTQYVASQQNINSPLSKQISEKKLLSYIASSMQVDQKQRQQMLISQQIFDLKEDELLIGKNQWVGQTKVQYVAPQQERQIFRPRKEKISPDSAKELSPNKQKELVKEPSKEKEFIPKTNTTFKLRGPRRKLPSFDGIYFKDQKFPKDPSFQEKYAQMRHFINTLNMANYLYVSPPVSNSLQPYKAYIGKGNNGLLVRIVLKNRWWWSLVDSSEQESANFVWTQLRKNNIVKQLKANNLNKKRQKSERSDSLESQSTPSTTLRRLTQDVNESLSGDEEVQTQKRSFSSAQRELPNTAVAFLKKDDPVILLQWAKILPQGDVELMKQVIQKPVGKQSKLLEIQNIQQLKLNQTIIQCNEPHFQKCHNHIENNFHLGNKKALFYNMRAYFESQMKNVFDYLPLTFHIKGLESPDYQKFKEAFNKRTDEVNLQNVNGKKKPIANIWIVKPGEFTNRGQGIKVCNDIKEIEEIVGSKETHKNGTQKTFIVQQYLDRPLLYNKRKFDIRCYLLFTTINGYQKGIIKNSYQYEKAYWYQEGYIRTSSFEFSTKNLQNKMVHLTNDAVQKKGDNYGKFEKANKVSFEEFSKFIESLGDKIDFYRDLYPKMRQLAIDQVRAVYGKMDPQHREQSMELFGLDYMVDETYKVWLIEANTNPAIEVCCPLLSRIIPQLIENIMRIVIDPIFPPPHFYNIKKLNTENYLEQNKFELIFDEVEDGPQILLNRENSQNQDFDLIEEESEEDEDNEEQGKE